MLHIYWMVNNVSKQQRVLICAPNECILILIPMEIHLDILCLKHKCERYRCFHTFQLSLRRITVPTLEWMLNDNCKEKEKHEIISIFHCACADVCVCCHIAMQMALFISLYVKLKAKYNHLPAKEYLYLQPKRGRKNETQNWKETEWNGTEGEEEVRVFVCSLSTVCIIFCMYYV